MSNRSDYLSHAKNVVIKLGTQLLSDESGKLDVAFVGSIAGQVTELRKSDVRVTIVSSGAIGCGVGLLGLDRRPTDLAKLQAVAAIGQRRLMDAWADAFEPHRIPPAQLLLTRQDIDDRTRFLNLRNTLSAVHDLGGIPIVNENDTVSTAELEKITFGDNDILAALIAHALPADLLVLLTVVDGLLDSDGKPYGVVTDLNEARQQVRPEKTPLGRGGMDSKLEAARMVTGAGAVMIVANGRSPRILSRILAGEEIGTLFAPDSHKKRPSSRSRWIGSVRPLGSIVVDDGAKRALVEKNRSLLPAGIVKVTGDFDRGDVVAIVSLQNEPVARGLSNYSSIDVAKIAGKKTQQVRQLFADGAYDEVVHRDNLVLE